MTWTAGAGSMSPRYQEQGEFRFENGWHPSVLWVAGVGILVSIILPGLTLLMPRWRGVYAPFFSVVISSGLCDGLSRARDHKPITTRHIRQE